MSTFFLLSNRVTIKRDKKTRVMEKSEKTPKKLKIRKRKNMLFFPLILPILRIKKNVKKAYFSRGEQGGAREERGGGAPKCNFLDFTPSFCQIVFNFMIASCEKSKQQFSTNKKKYGARRHMAEQKQAFNLDII